MRYLGFFRFNIIFPQDGVVRTEVLHFVKKSVPQSWVLQKYLLNLSPYKTELITPISKKLRNQNQIGTDY